MCVFSCVWCYCCLLTWCLCLGVLLFGVVYLLFVMFGFVVWWCGWVGLSGWVCLGVVLIVLRLLGKLFWVVVCGLLLVVVLWAGW